MEDLAMRTALRKFGVVAAIALAIAGTSIAAPTAAQAQHHMGGGGGHWGGGGHGGGGWGGFGPGFVGGLALGAVAGSPYYYGGPYAYDYYGGDYAYGYGGDCYIQRRVFINHWGRRIVRHVRVCD